MTGDAAEFKSFYGLGASVVSLWSIIRGDSDVNEILFTDLCCCGYLIAASKPQTFHGTLCSLYQSHGLITPYFLLSRCLAIGRS